jgi:hypothetical protein
MKRQVVVQLFCLMIGLTFIVVGSISVTCAYHHGIDGPEKPQQTSSSLFCFSLSKLSHQVQISSSGYTLFYYDQFYVNLVKSNEDLDSNWAKNTPARSPPYLSILSTC